MEKKVRVNIGSGIIHDLRNPCWWTMKTNKDSVIDFYTIEEAEAELANRSIVPHKCEHCKCEFPKKLYLVSKSFIFRSS